MRKTIITSKALAFIFVLGMEPEMLHAPYGKEYSDVSSQNFPRITKTSVIGNFYADFSGKNISAQLLQINLNKWLGADGSHSLYLLIR